VTAPIVPPYDRLPQLARWARMNDGGLDYSVDPMHALSRRLVLDGQPNADRGSCMPAVAPGAAALGLLHAQAAAARQPLPVRPPLADGRTAASRVLPTVSLDSGLVFERDARYFGRAFTQTLEPRLKYVYTPYRDQNGCPTTTAACTTSTSPPSGPTTSLPATTASSTTTSSPPA
jgi:LPS-assembly protein